jgi:hypothetical protein
MSFQALNTLTIHGMPYLVILSLDVCWTFASMAEAKPASLWFPPGGLMMDLVVTLLAYFEYHVGWWRQC